MAVAPLFVQDMDTLRARLRLSGTVNSDGVALIEEGVLAVRQEIYRRLGATRITTLLATSHTDTPSTDDEYRRAIAESLEIKWVRYKLFETMPILFKESSGNSLEIFNEEAAFREGRPSRAAVRALFQEILEDVKFLKEGITASEKRGDAALIEPDEAPPLPGESIWGTQTRSQVGG